MSTYRKKLIEVALPLDAINRESAREKSIRHGHPSTLHLWWARRPLAACRAVLFASLVDDPSSDPQLRRPDGSRNEDAEGERRAHLFNLIEELVKWENSNNDTVINAARAEIARSVASRKLELGELKKDTVIWRAEKSEEKREKSKTDGDSARSSRAEKSDEKREKSKAEDDPALSSFLSPLSSSITVWDLLVRGAVMTHAMFDKKSGKPSIAVSPTKLPAEAVNAFLAEHAPPVLDPFCGGGSIPLEAQRLGLRAYASDLNPVPVLITKALIEIPPKFAGMPPVNPAARKEAGEKRKENALPGPDRMAEGDAGGTRGVSPGAATAAGRDIRDAQSDHASDGLDSGEHRGGLGTGIHEGEGAIPGGRSGLAGRGGDAADAVRRSEVVSSRRNAKSAGSARRSQSNSDDASPEREERGRSEERGLRKEKRDAEGEPLSSLLFSRSYRGAEGLAEDVRYYGQWMRDVAAQRIGRLYPKVRVTKEMAADRPDLKPYIGQELTVIAWLWARTVPSPNPALGGAPVPLVRSFWLSTKKGKEAWVEPVIDRGGKDFHFVVSTGTPPKTFDPGKGTVSRKGGVCWLSKGPMPFDHIRAEGKAGRMQVRLMAIVAEGERGRVYLSPNEEQARIAERAEPTWRPDAALPDNPRDFKTPNYGMRTFADLFTPRQLVALTTFSDLVMEAREKVLADARAAHAAGLFSLSSPLASSPEGYADAVATYLAFMISKMADINNSLCTWKLDRGCPVHVFARQALPMVWDYPEANVFSESSGSWDSVFWHLMSSMCDAVLPAVGANHDARQFDATKIMRRGDVLCSTDPPYYDNIGYADLSDFFYVWLRRSLGSVYPDLFRTLLTPKAEELIATPYRHDGSKDRAMRFFESGLGSAFERLREAQRPDYPLTVYYAFKQSESDEDQDEESADLATASTGWETMLEGLLRAGFAINGTWPVRTEMKARQIAMDANALASSIVLVCHPRSADAAMTTRKDFVAALKKELPVALRDLQSGNIAPVDLAQAAIGPGMAIYSRYARVVNSDGSRMPVRTALQLINQALDEVLSEQESEFDSETRWAIKWFEQHAHDEGAFGDAETLSKAMAVSVRGLRDAGLVKDGQGKVRLLRREELGGGEKRKEKGEKSGVGKDYDPVADRRPTVWEITQHLILALETDGDAGAAQLLRRAGGLGEVARDLAYRLYSTCERKKWAEEARSYNGLVVAWPEVVRMSREQKASTGTQAEMAFE